MLTDCVARATPNLCSPLKHFCGHFNNWSFPNLNLEIGCITYVSCILNWHVFFTWFSERFVWFLWLCNTLGFIWLILDKKWKKKSQLKKTKTTVSDKNSWDTLAKRCFFPSRAHLVPLKVVYRSSVTKSCTPTLRGQGDPQSVPTILTETVVEWKLILFVP